MSQWNFCWRDWVVHSFLLNLDLEPQVVRPRQVIALWNESNLARCGWRVSNETLIVPTFRYKPRTRTNFFSFCSIIYIHLTREVFCCLQATRRTCVRPNPEDGRSAHIIPPTNSGIAVKWVSSGITTIIQRFDLQWPLSHSRYGIAITRMFQIKQKTQRNK